jgi:TPR repeat protein
MSNEGEKATDLVPSTSSALSRVGSKSLVQRGMQDWLSAEDAERCFKKGWDLLNQSRQEEAALWFRKAAEQGLASAQNEIGFAHECGRGVPEDHDQAAFWYRKAADQGNADAQFCLAVMYMEGRGVPHDPKQAVSLFTKSADQGNIGAKAALAKLRQQTTRKG